MIDWQGRVALVTGAGSGIGRALSEALASRGARLFCADIDGDAAAETAIGIDGEALSIDLAEPDAALTLVEHIHARTGGIDFVASNAGVGYRKRLLKADLDDPALARMFELNMLAALRLAQAWMPHLEAGATRGRLMITGSENSLSVPTAVQGFGLGLYAASKHGVLALAEWLRDEMAGGDKPLDVHILLPGGVYTGMTADGLGADPAQWPAAMAIITPERCAEIALAGLDAGLFHIPTHRHLADDMQARNASIAESLRVLGPS